MKENKMLTEETKIQPEEMLKIGILAVFMGGFLDSYTYVLHGGVFANTQTGNIILMSIYLFEKKWANALLRFVPIGTFFIGIFLFEIIRKLNKKYCTNISLIVQALLVLIIGLGAFKENSIVICSSISFICALQLLSFRKVQGNAYSTIMCTGNLRSFSEYFTKWILHKNKEDLKLCLLYLLIIFIFCLGVYLGMFFVKLMGFYSILLMLINIFAKYIVLHIRHKKE